MTLLESNSQFNVLFQNQQILQSTHVQYELQQLERLDAGELNTLAKIHSIVATMIIKHETLLRKFEPGVYQSYVVDILLAHPVALMDDFFNHPRGFHFDEWAKDPILSACKKNIKFLLHILNSPESNWLNGYEIAHLIENNSETQPHIYQFEKFKKRHEAYKTLVEKITTRLVLDDELFSAKVKSIYQPIFDNMGEFGEYELLNVMQCLAKSYNHQILAANCVLIRDGYGWDRFSNYFAEISAEFFCVTYDNESLRNGLYLYSDRLCQKYFVAFERLIQDPKALSNISDEKLFKLQQKWVCVEANKVSDIFNENSLLMQRWHKGHQINKLLHQGIMVSDYQKQQSLQNEPESIIQIRLLISELQDKLAFGRIIFKGDKTFITCLAEQASLLSTTSSLNPIDECILPGIFWFLALTNNPTLLNENLPLDIIGKQIEAIIDDIKITKTIDSTWLIKCHIKDNDETVYELYSAYEQEKRWLNRVPADSFTETFNALKSAVERVRGPFENEESSFNTANDSLMATLQRLDASMDRLMEANARLKALSVQDESWDRLRTSLSSEHDKTREVLSESMTQACFTLGCYCSSIGVYVLSIAYGIYGNRPIHNHTEDTLDIYAGALALGGALSITGGLLVAKSFFTKQRENKPNNQAQSNEQQLDYK